MELTPIDNSKIVTAKQWLFSFHEECGDKPWAKEVDWDKFYVSGGAIASLLQGETPKDVDIYCEDAGVAEKFKKILISKYRKDIKETEDYREFYAEDGKMVSEWAVTMKCGASFIFKNTGKPKEIKKSFDYVHTMAHYQFRTEQKASTLYISPLTYHCAVNKLLIVNNKISMTTSRREKFEKRGYKP